MASPQKQQVGCLVELTRSKAGRKRAPLAADGLPGLARPGVADLLALAGRLADEFEPAEAAAAGESAPPRPGRQTVHGEEPEPEAGAEDDLDGALDVIGCRSLGIYKILLPLTYFSPK